MILVRPMLALDVDAIFNVQSEAYAAYFLESADVIADRFNNSPSTAWVVEREGQVCAYLVGYWSDVGKINPLNASFQPAKHTQCLYLHDLAISTNAQGLGIAKQLIIVATKFALSHNATAMALLSVQNSKFFWENMGFSEFVDISEQQKIHLMGYQMSSSNVFYMLKNLTPLF